MILKRSWAPIGVVVITQVAALALGWVYARQYPIPSGLFNLDVPENAFEEIPNVGFLPSFDVGSIMFHNLRVLLLEALLGAFSFGTLSVVLMMIPLAIIGFFAGEVPLMGASPWLFLATFILPHGIVELPAAFIATGLALRLGASVVSRPAGLTLTQGVLLALADFLKVFVCLVIPLLILAAMLEVWLTPWIVTRVW
jgi:uncharacterized membrane protein SpoIIM required for sporulation